MAINEEVRLPPPCWPSAQANYVIFSTIFASKPTVNSLS